MVSKGFLCAAGENFENLFSNVPQIVKFLKFSANCFLDLRAFRKLSFFEQKFRKLLFSPNTFRKLSKNSFPQIDPQI